MVCDWDASSALGGATAPYPSAAPPISRRHPEAHAEDRRQFTQRGPCRRVAQAPPWWWWREPVGGIPLLRRRCVRSYPTGSRIVLQSHAGVPRARDMSVRGRIVRWREGGQRSAGENGPWGRLRSGGSTAHERPGGGVCDTGAEPTQCARVEQVWSRSVGSSVARQLIWPPNTGKGAAGTRPPRRVTEDVEGEKRERLPRY